MKQGEILRLVEEFENTYDNPPIKLEESSSSRSALDFRKSENKYKFFQWLFSTPFFEAVGKKQRNGKLKNIRSRNSKKSSYSNEKSLSDGLVLHHIYMVHGGKRGEVTAEITPQAHGKIQGQILRELDDGLKEQFYNLYVNFINKGFNIRGESNSVITGRDETAEAYAERYNRNLLNKYFPRLKDKGFTSDEIDKFFDVLFISDSEAEQKQKKNGKGNLETRNKTFYNFILEHLGERINGLGQIPSADQCVKAFDEVLGTYDIQSIGEALSVNELDIEVVNSSGIFPEILNIPVSLLDFEREDTIKITEPRENIRLHAYLTTKLDDNTGIYRLDEKEIEDFYSD